MSETQNTAGADNNVEILKEADTDDSQGIVKYGIDQTKEKKVGIENG